MNYFDDENKAIEHFQEYTSAIVYLSEDIEETAQVFKKIYNKSEWAEWKDSSKKEAPPPDFYSDKFKLMMEVMRVDDHSRVNDRGQVINPTNIREAKIQREFRSNLIRHGYDPNKDNIELFVNAVSGLPTFEDHNYTFYYEGFARVLNHHKDRIALYRKNHPSYKLIFFVFDESSAYVEASVPIKDLCVRAFEKFTGEPHLFYRDKRFVDIITSLDIDYLIWYTPFKRLESDEEVPLLPNVAVYDMKKYIPYDTINYSLERTISSEANKE